MMQDISERKQVEMALRASEARLQLFIEHAPASLAMFDDRMRYLAVSRRWLDDYALGDQDIIGRSHYELFPEIPDDWKIVHRRALAGEVIRAEADLFERENGRVQWLRWEVRPWYDAENTVGGIVVFTEDITERRQAEQATRERQAALLREQRQARLAALNLMEDAVAARARAESASASLRESEQRLLMAQEGAQVGIWELDLSSGRVYWSPECARLYGLAPGSVRCMQDWRPRIHPADLRRIDEQWSQIGSGAPIELEFRIRLDSGETRWLLSKGRAQCDERGRPVRLSGINLDITEQKHLTGELERYRLNLEEQVATRTAELVAARDEAERLARVKSDFLANMSHEIRTPLNAVLGLARIGARDSAGRGVQATFGRILDAGEHLLGVINDILDFSKIEAGRVILEARPFQLAAVIANAGSLLGGAARQKGLAYRVEQPPDLPDWVLGDAQRLQQILVNLLSNAVKFTERGEVCLRVSRQGDDTMFEVSDSGIGLTAEEIERLFQPFEQADGTTTRKYGGTGLGLAISRNLARVMGGEIRVDSTPGTGSRFTLSLPLPTAEPGLVEPAEAAPAAARPLAGIRVLAAEDVEVNRLILEDLLTHEGAQSVLVENGRQAVEQVETMGAGVFDLVLMDVQMPEMDGYAATRRLHELAPGLPVIGLTAHALAEERAKCHAAGMVDHVTKPIDPPTLVAAILRHAHRPSPAALRQIAPTPRPTMPAPDAAAREPAPGLIDRAALLQRYQGRQAFIDKLITIVRETNVEVPARLRAAARDGDLDTVIFTAHTLKGMAGNLQAPRLSELARETEAAAKAGQADALELAGALAETMDRLLAEVAERSD